jgi:spermidine synthase
LFIIEPLFARMMLPLLGGSPAVWNTAIVFYQTVLLAGYGYVHWMTRQLSPRRQVWLHLTLLFVPLVVLPIAIPGGWVPPTQTNPVPWMLALMAVAVGLPFFVVATTSPLLQKWFAGTGQPQARDPYFLYAASNLGSMIGLLSYPFLLEPWLRLKQQSGWWAVGYLAFAVLTAVCAWVARRNPVIAATTATEADASTKVTSQRRLRWVLLAAVPSSLMLGVTTHLSTDIAAVPLLWVVPLAVYLLSFILVFARRPPVPHRWLVRALPGVVLPLVVLLCARAVRPLPLVMGWHVLALFVVAMVCHGELANDRPASRYLTEFYLWLSVGGVVGGAFNALVAPVIFSRVLEYPLALAAGCALVPTAGTSTRRQRLLDVMLPLAVGVFAANLAPLLEVAGVNSAAWLVMLKAVVPVVIALAFVWRPVRFGLTVGVVLLVNTWLPGEQERTLHLERSFFGIHRVMIDATGQRIRLSHGTVVHGMQSLVASESRLPLSYYHPRGPIGQVFAALRTPQRVAVVGLGAGSLAAYAQPQQQWTYYEIDPAVANIAANTNYFTFLAECRAPLQIVLGDARLTLSATTAKYDLLVLDAYSSDAVPLHLITREALRVYTDHLTPTGCLAMHISNRYLDLQPVVANLAADAGLVCFIQSEASIPEADRRKGRQTSTWAILAHEASDLGPLASDPRWQPALPVPEQRVWTDDYASLFSVLRWR